MATSAHFSQAIRGVPRWAWIVFSILVLVVVFLVVFDWNWLKGPIERRVQDATGRTFEIGGDLDVDLGLKPRIRADSIRFANAPWSKHGDMVAAERVEFRVSLLPLFRGRFELPYVRATKPEIVIERNRDGQGNWVFDVRGSKERASKAPPALLVNQLLIDDGSLRLYEPTFKTEVALDVRSEDIAKGAARAPLVAEGSGKYRGHPFAIDIRVDSPLDLVDRERPYRVDAKVSAGETRARARGALVGQLQLEDFALKFDMSGENLGDLFPLLGVPVPDTPPYALSGELGRHGTVWSYKDFRGKVGDSDMQGDASIDLGGDRPLLTANVVSNRLDFDDLGSVVGAPPSTKSGETASDEQRKVAADMKAKGKVLPDAQFNLEKLRVMDADVKMRAAQINAPKLPLEQMNVHVQLKDGVLKLDPLNFKIAGGAIKSRLNLDAREPEIRTTLTGDVERLELGKLFPTVELTKRGAGKLSGALAVEMRGNSVAQLLGDADGNIGLIMGPGHVSNLLVELAGLDIAESLKFLLDKDKEIPLRCAYADFKVENGVVGAHSLAFDTSDTVVYGEGSINLRDEAIDMKLSPQPKDRSPLSARVPLKIGGSFKDPSFAPEAGPLVARGAAAAALYALAPPAALLALIETGPGENIDCGPATKEGRVSRR